MGGVISGIAETAFHALKITVIVTLCGVFMIAINSLLGLLGGIASATVIGEVFSLISMYLPFNAGVVFSSIALACGAILAFKVAKKIWDMATWAVSAI